MKTLNLGDLRLIGMRLLAGLIAALAVAVILGALLATVPGKLPAAVMALLLPILPCMMAWQRRTDDTARLLSSITVVAMPALLLFVFEGRAWQVDLHMVFFALLAVVSILCDWKAICAAAVVVALHHIVFGLLLPDWIFNGGGSIGRVALHAVILIVEAATLMWVAERIVALIAAIELQDDARQRADASLIAERSQQSDAVAVVTHSLGRGLAALTAGDLTAVIDVEYPEGYGALRTNFNDALASLRRLLGSVTASVAGIRHTSSQIAQASEDLARRTESNAASLEQTSAALVKVEARIKATGAAAIATVARADQAIATVADGRSRTEDAVHAMGRVSESAKGIDSVIEGLDKIAFQTRVLAMNAAVEAGRAGDAGRGFAVVADLVSALAMRAEDEAKRARDQLTVTQDEIVTAVEAVRKVDGTFVDISSDVSSVHGLLEDMAADNVAQSLAISEINGAIGVMDQATQQNAAMVEETSAAAHSLKTEVSALADEASLFHIDHDAPARPAHFRPSPETISARALARG
ncbi:methyl-accepting chemotaxis protein [Sphingomonas sp. AR_OL41]|uniref:methyl-accepting chemotaxis protein n=1 Tax=Sphingomonas sp. AR_OL41 TaxID=3042729 RepID=UPI00247FCC0E|nr:methyl-accepting chemotaxis protein [Sphingomonas sp. AR_OL41]MDH7973474.1 methyl-accepting chemotaxis protein [Sphingomonas sp. AR_OL41]